MKRAKTRDDYMLTIAFTGMFVACGNGGVCKSADTLKNLCNGISEDRVRSEGFPRLYGWTGESYKPCHDSVPMDWPSNPLI